MFAPYFSIATKSVSRLTPFSWRSFSTKAVIDGPYNFIGGQKNLPIDSERFINVLNPATSVCLAKVAASGEKEIDRAVSSSNEAFVSWSEVFLCLNILQFRYWLYFNIYVIVS